MELYITIDCDDDCVIIPRGSHRFNPTSYFTAKVKGSDKGECRRKARDLFLSLEASPIGGKSLSSCCEVNDYIASAIKALQHSAKVEFGMGGNRTVKWQFPQEINYTVEF
jgi:hypothetical protein